MKFISGVKSLIDNGYVKNRTEIIDSLEWEKTMFSNVLNGRRNIPNDKYRKFTEVYSEFDVIKENFAIKRSGDVGNELGKIKEQVLTLQASVNVLLTTTSSISAAQKDKEFASVYGELQHAIKDEIRRLAGEL